MDSRVISVTDNGMWRGRRSWTVVMEDENGRAQVSARGDTEAEALAGARATFESRRIWTPEDRRSVGRANEALRKGLSQSAHGW